MSESERPIVVCGLGRMGARLLEDSNKASVPVTLIDNRCDPEDARLDGVEFIKGDFRKREVLERAGVADARAVIVLTADDLVNIATMLTVRSISREVRIIVRLFNQNLMSRLGSAVDNIFTLSTSQLTAPFLAATAMTGQGIGTFQAPSWEQDSAEESTWYQLTEVHIRAGSQHVGKRIHDVFDPATFQVIGHGGARGPLKLLLDVDPEAKLGPGDRLLLCAPPKELGAWTSSHEEERPTHVMWASWLRRQGRVLWSTMSGLDLAVVVCTLVLLVVIVGSTAVFSLGVQKYSIPDALFRTISVMAAGANLREVEGESGAIKVFVSVLRIVGMALMAAFTAIVTNYLLRARLRGALEVRRIPESGHFVVCGLTTVGFRVTEFLIKAGERVVVIEKDSDNRFVATARRLGAAVIVGDATVEEVLRQAHAGTARAFLALAGKDLANLEMGLLVRDLNPTQRIVLMMEDPQLANMLRDEAEIRLAVSLPALAAPAFLAPLFGDRLAGVFFVEERLLVVLDLEVNEGESLFLDQPLRAVAIDYKLMPIALKTTDGAPRRLYDHRLRAGDRLLAIQTLEDLERLLHRRPPEKGFTIRVVECPIPTRDWLVGLLRTYLGWEAPEAENKVAHLPMTLPLDLSKGQAEDLFSQLVRERVEAEVVSTK